MSKPESALPELLMTLTRTYHRLSRLSDRLHGSHGITTGDRSLLLLIDRIGPLTNAEIAEMRAVSRQLIQRISIGLIKRKLLEHQSNPDDARAPRLCLTTHGRAEVQALKAREAELWATAAKQLPADRLVMALEVLNRIDDHLG